MDSADPHYSMAQRRIGTLVAKRYTIDRVLGLGGMAVVYAATHRNQKKVAIKMLHPELSHHLEIRQRFLREGYVANTVKHRGAVDVIDDDIAEDGSAFLVMEMLEGETVEEVATSLGGRLDVPTTLAIGQELCSVIAAAHEAGIVHRDIKPANLFITTEGDVKVLDFGIARLREAGGALVTNAGMLLGTPGYMSPEQALGHTDSIGPHTDTWAIGATMFSLLTGRTVHLGRSGPEVVVCAARDAAPSILTVRPDLLPAAAEVIDRALQFEREARFRNAGEMKAALRDLRLALFGEVFPDSILAPLVGGVARTERRPSRPTQPAARRSPHARTLLDVPAASTTAIPVSGTPFVQPLASKRTLLVAGGALALALVAGGGWLATHRPHTDAPATPMVNAPVSVATMPASSTPVEEPIETTTKPAATTTQAPPVVPIGFVRPKVIVDAGIAVPAASSVAPVESVSARPDPGAVR